MASKGRVLVTTEIYGFDFALYIQIVINKLSIRKIKREMHFATIGSIETIQSTNKVINAQNFFL